MVAELDVNDRWAACPHKDALPVREHIVTDAIGQRRTVKERYCFECECGQVWGWEP